MEKDLREAIKSAIKEMNINCTIMKETNINLTTMKEFEIYGLVLKKYLKGEVLKNSLGQEYVVFSSDEIMKQLNFARSTVRTYKLTLKRAGLLEYELEKLPKYANRYYLDPTFLECVIKNYKKEQEKI